MSDDLKAVTDEAFPKEVVSSEVPVLVDFWAPRCGPCHALEPVVEELATKYRGQVAFRKLDVDEHLEVPQQYGVRSIPTLLLFKSGQIVGQWVGNAPGMRAKLDAALQKLTLP